MEKVNVWLVLASIMLLGSLVFAQQPAPSPNGAPVPVQMQKQMPPQQGPGGVYPDHPWGSPGMRQRHLCGMFLVLCLVMHVLLAGWVYQDLRQRQTGSGIWIVLVLLAGFLAALVYAVVRIGDKPPQA